MNGNAWVKYSDFKNKKTTKALQVKKRYNNNVYADGAKTKSFINKQSKKSFSKINFAKSNVKFSGCGIIAAHNILVMKGIEKPFVELVAEFDYNMLIDGLQGVYIGTIKKCLRAYVSKCNYVTGRGNLEYKVKNSKNGVFRVCWNKGGAHFVAVDYNKNTKRFYLYNDGKTSTGYSYGSSLEKLEEKMSAKIRQGLAVTL